MTPPRRPDRRLAAVLVVGMGTGALLALAVVWGVAPPEVRDGLVDAVSLAAVVAAVAAVIGGGLVARWVAAHLVAARRLATEIDLIASVDPSHRASIGASEEVAVVARAVNGLAARFWESISERDRAIIEGRRQAEQDRERLVALMAELTTGVLVCSADGRILLYNSSAVRILADDSGAAPVGLGRSVFSVLDRGAVTNAIHRLELDSTTAAPVRLTTVGPGGQLLRTSVGPVRADGATGLAGFVLMVDEATVEHEGRQERDELIRSVLEEARGRLAGIGGAAEMLERYDDLTAADIDRFNGIIREEADRLTTYLADVQERHRKLAGTGWELAEMLCRDLLWALQRRLEAEGMAVAMPEVGDELWLNADAGGVVEALAGVAHLTVEAGIAVAPVALSATVSGTGSGAFVAIELAFGRPSGEPGLTAGVLDTAVTGGPLGRMARRHGGEAWWKRDRDGALSLTVLLPRVEAVTPITGPVPSEERPTTFDFDLLTRHPVEATWAGMKLSALSYTVFDLETTGVHPLRGDRILSVGAVRIVNGRLLRHEAFDTLVDPERDIPGSSTAIHGITQDQVVGQPTIGTVLPRFASFSEGTILVGHNVSFDMRFLETAGKATRVRIDAAVLDTLLLAELAFGESDTHSLDWMAETLGVDVIGRHTALGDALVTAEVFLRLMPLLETRGLTTVGAVTDASATTRYARLRY